VLGLPVTIISTALVGGLAGSYGALLGAKARSLPSDNEVLRAQRVLVQHRRQARAIQPATRSRTR
jgi:hypothetical protein